MNKELIEDLADVYRECLEQASAIPMDSIKILGEEMLLTDEDYRNIASCLFIEYNKQQNRKSNGNGNGDSSFDKPTTEPQQKLIAKLAVELGTEAEKVIQQYLDNLDCVDREVKSTEVLSQKEASSLIDILIENKKQMVPKKPGPKKPALKQR